MNAEQSFQIEEIAGLEPAKLSEDQLQKLGNWDAWLEELVPKMEEDHKKAHEIKPWEFRQFNTDYES